MTSRRDTVARSGAARGSARSALSRDSKSGPLQEVLDDLLRAEELTTDLARRLRVHFVVAFDLLDRGDDVVERFEREEPTAGRQHVAEPRLLGHDRASGGEV